MSLPVPDRDAWFPQDDAFPRPDWPSIRGWMRAWLGDEEQGDAWQQATRHWLARLCASLGGTYAVVESPHFHLLSELDEKARRRMLDFLEKGRSTLIDTLGDVAWTSTTGKHVVLRFSDFDDYLAYISHFFPDGEFATSGGIFLSADYCHIAFPQSFTMDYERQTLAHELAHNLLLRLPLPTWLGEALAEGFSTQIAGAPSLALDRELRAEHRAYWNAETIQGFWMGSSFGTVEGQRVSYSLAQVLLDIIHRELQPSPEIFRRFVKQSDWNDAGEAAAHEQLETGLSAIAATFLGPGDWSPKPAAWKAKQEKR